MEDGGSITSLTPYAAVAFLLAGLMWFGVGSVALKRASRSDGGLVFQALGVTAYVTGAAFLLGLAAWLG